MSEVPVVEVTEAEGEAVLLWARRLDGWESAANPPLYVVPEQTPG